MNILLRGGNFHNKGAEAMLRTVQRQLARRIPEAYFCATLPFLESQFANICGISPLSIAKSKKSKFFRTVPIFSGLLSKFHSFTNFDFSRANKNSNKSAFEIFDIGQVDAVLDISGFAYGDAWNVCKLKDSWAWVEYCLIKKKPYVFLPQAWGTFKQRDIASFGRKICSNATMVFSRDADSTTHLSNLLNIPSDDLRTIPDIVFSFHGERISIGRSLLNNIGIESDGKPIVALVPNMRVYERTSGLGAANHYVKILVDIGNYIIEHLGANLLLLPNEIYVPGSMGADDRFICGIIQSHIRRYDHCFVVRDQLSSEAIKSLIGQADLLVGSRFHSLVFGLSQGVPVIALGWSHKYPELLRSFGMERYAVEHNRMDSLEIITLVKQAWDQRESLKNRICDVVPILQDKVEQMFDEVANVICGANY